ncbi:MAG: VOC family protein [Actinomycetes bacterium]
MPESPVKELRVVITADDFAAMTAFYRDGLGLPVLASWDRPDGSGAILDAGRATIEVVSRLQSESIDQIEAGRPTGDAIRIAVELEDSVAGADRLVEAGATRVGEPVDAPWGHRSVRLAAPDGTQLTLFTPIED